MWARPEASRITTTDDQARQDEKFRLVRRLYERGYDRETVQELFRIIDWLVQLPQTLEQRFMDQVHELEEERKMPFVAPAERIWEERGADRGKQEGEAELLLHLLARKFGPEAAEAYRDRIEQADAETLLMWSERILTAEKAEEIFA